MQPLMVLSSWMEPDSTIKPHHQWQGLYIAGLQWKDLGQHQPQPGSGDQARHICVSPLCFGVKDTPEGESCQNGILKAEIQDTGKK